MFNAQTYITDQGLNASQLSENWIIELVKKDPSLTFGDCYLIAKQLFDDVVPHMNRFCEASYRLLDVQDAFEYAAVYVQKDLLITLFDRHGLDDLLIDWVNVYKLNLEALNSELEPYQILDNLNDLYGSVSHLGLKTKIELMKLYVYQQKLNYYGVLPLENSIKEKIKKLESGYFKSALVARLGVFLLFTDVYINGDRDMAERNAFAVIVNEHSAPQMLGAAHHFAAISATYFNYQTSLKHFKEAQKYYEKEQLLSYQSAVLQNNDIPMLKNIWEIPFEPTDATATDEVAHQLINLGDRQKAIDLLNSNEATSVDHFYINLYLAVAKHDLQAILKLMAARPDQRKLSLLRHWLKKEFQMEV